MNKKIMIVTPFWQRPEISMIYWKAIDDLKDDGLDVNVIAVVSDEENTKMAFDNAYMVIQMPNEPLGAKWAAGVRVLEAMDYDYLMILGSDDICSPRLFTEFYANALENKVRYLGTKDILAMDVKTMKCRYFPGYDNYRTGESIGNCRMIKSELVTRAKYRLFVEANHKGQDYYMNQVLTQLGSLNMLHEMNMDPYRISLKVDESFSKIIKGYQYEYDIDLHDFYSDEVINMIYQHE